MSNVPSATVVTEHVRAELLAHAPQGIAPGAEVWLGLAIEHAPGWHTYWKNPGDSGLPTSLAWQLPAGVVAQEIHWPTPKALPLGPLTNYGYVDALLLPVPVRIEPGFAASSLTVRLHAEWLVCEENCIPESGDFVLELPAGAPSTAHASAFAVARGRVPTEATGVKAYADADDTAMLATFDGLPQAFVGKTLQFFPEAGGVIDHAAPLKQQWDGARWMVRVPLSPQRSESPPTLHAVLAAPGQMAGLRVALPVTWPGATGTVAAAPANSALAGIDWGTWSLPGAVLLTIVVAWAWHRFGPKG